MNNTLTLQAFLDQQWQDIAELVFNEFNLIEIAYLLKLRSPLKKRYHNKKSSQRE